MITHANPVSVAGGAPFSRVPAARIERSAMDRSSSLDTTFDGGYLVPVYFDEILPGDTINLNITKLIRLNTPLLPIMHNVYVDTHAWFVPYRLLWENWQRFMGEQDDPDDDITSLVTPKINFTSNISESSLSDYLGLIPGLPATTDDGINAFTWRAYNRIWNAWYRDENLQDPVAQNTDDGPDTEGDYELLKRGKRKDYFTSCLPFAQKGDAVTLPLGTVAPVVLNSSTNPTQAVYSNTHAPLGATTSIQTNANSDLIYDGGVTTIAIDPNGNLEADLSGATAATINTIREAFALQHLLERDARGGTRYIEILHSHFGVVSPDARLQRPEFLGGGTDAIMIHSVPQTSVAASTPQGHLAAYGTCTGSHNIVHSFVEHGVLMVLMSVRAELKYSQGVPRMMTRNTRYDYYWPSFANLGEQPVFMREIMFHSVPATDDNVFGYQERYGEYRYAQSRLTGLMRAGVTGSLSAYNLAQQFIADPELNADFIEQSDPWDRVVAVSSEPTFRANVHFALKHVRPMPIIGIPGLRMM